ncbi:putative ascorbate ferrireductase (transmembrane) [Rosa chinensis]|uniref:ascorbate ferrireductase (transmembrane) n=2 Tax=Rosa chinensis TaxID=74649 RepID=A0A2P6SN30_ROSCH|nr:putative ascorbate ferrireductase (transmembrane) [Rosa chinensis]
MPAIGVSSTPLTFVMHALGVAALVLVLVWSIYFRGGFAWEATDKSLIFNLHPFLMVLGLVFLGGEAIISYRYLPLRKDVKKLVHLVLHAIALALGIIGIYTAFKNHNETGVANLYSLHSWIGIGVICLYGIQWIYGFLVFFYPKGSPGLRSDSMEHFGLFVYILVVGNATLGFLEKLTFLESSGVEKFGSEAFLVNFTALVTLVFGAFVILISVISQGPVEEDHSYSDI